MCAIYFPLPIFPSLPFTPSLLCPPRFITVMCFPPDSVPLVLVPKNCRNLQLAHIREKSSMRNLCNPLWCGSGGGSGSPFGKLITSLDCSCFGFRTLVCLTQYYSEYSTLPSWLCALERTSWMAHENTAILILLQGH